MKEPDVASLISAPAAIALLDAEPVSTRKISVPLLESAGFSLAEHLRCDRDFPPFDKSLMDGYAVRAVDVAHAPVQLPVGQHIAAGQRADGALGAGEAMAIMTGAPMPRGADAVVPVEQTEKVGESVRILRGATAGQFIARRGADAQMGEVVVSAGMVMNAARIAAAASVGAARVVVFAKPSVAVLGTGDELVPVDHQPGEAQIRSSNNAMLMSLLKARQFPAMDLGIARDDRAVIADAIAAGLRHDVLIVTGGMSMGEHDYVPGLLREMGAEIRISKLRMRPGKPFVFARMPTGQFVFGLPGNPVSGFVCFTRLVSRLLARMAGQLPSPTRWATLAVALPQNGEREFYQPGQFDGRSVHPLNWKGSADLFTLARANALLIRPENHSPMKVGEWVEILEI